ncbi:MAG: SIS domain-containing protein [Chloroflexi bacterium]|nr:SIS domain-containing protein [Chloroflexota bacterium]
MTNPMREQVLLSPQLLREQFAAMEERSRALLPTPTIFAIREVILTGCGDSQIAGALLREEWLRLTTIPTQAWNAMQAARYEPALPRRQSPQDPLVVAISISGGVARTLEAAEQWRARGATVVALTANPASPLGQAAEFIYELTIPPLEGDGGPGVLSFLLATQALYLLAIRFGEVRGRFTQDEAQALREGWSQGLVKVEQYLPTLDSTMQRITGEAKVLSRYELLGSGPARAAAAFGAAKILEASGHPALHQDIEEWLHLHYFAQDPLECGTWLLCSSDDPAFSRARELEPYLRRLERPHCYLTDEQGAALLTHAIDLPIAPCAVFTAAVQALALALFAAHLSERCGAKYGRGARGPWQDCADGRTTRLSERLPLPGEA